MTIATRLMILAGAATGMCSVSMAQSNVDTDQVRATVREMLADAETRSSLLDGGSTGGYNGKNFYLASADGNFTMNFSAFTQFRYVASFAQNNNGASSRPPNDSFDSGFTNRLTKAKIWGNFLSKDWGYLMEVRMLDSSGGGGVQLDDMYITYKINDNFKTQFGQYKPLFLKETSNADVYTLAAERGVVELGFGQSRTQGIQLVYTNGPFWIGGDIDDGFRTKNTNWNANGAGGTVSESDFALDARAQYLFAGNYDQLKDYTSLPSEDLAAYVGAAIAFEQGLDDPNYVPPVGGGPGGTNAKYQFLTYTVDGQVEGGGFTLYGSFVGANTEFRDQGRMSLNDFGATLQGGWRFTQEWEVFAKGEWIGLDSRRKQSVVNGGTGLPAGSLCNNFFVTAGINYYIAGHAAKVTLDVITSLNRTDALASNGSSIVPNGNPANNGAGRILPSSGAIGLIGSSKGGETAIRLQFQGIF